MRFINKLQREALEQNALNVIYAQGLTALTGSFSLPENSSQGAFAGYVLGKQQGSRLVLSDNAGGRIQLSGNAIQAGPVSLDWETGQSHFFTVRELLLGGAFLDTQFTLTVVNATDALGNLSIADATGVEGGSVIHTVFRTGGSDGTISVNWSMSGYVPADINSAVNGTLTFAPGELSKTITVQTVNNSVYQGNRSYTITLSNATAGVTISDATATGTITDDEVANFLTPNPQGTYPETDEYVEYNVEWDNPAVTFSVTGVDMADVEVTPLTSTSVRCSVYLDADYKTVHVYNHVLTNAEGATGIQAVTLTVIDVDAPIVSNLNKIGTVANGQTITSTFSLSGGDPSSIIIAFYRLPGGIGGESSIELQAKDLLVDPTANTLVINDTTQLWNAGDQLGIWVGAGNTEGWNNNWYEWDYVPTGPGVPNITGNPATYAPLGQGYSFQPVTNGGLAPLVYTATGLPPGLSINSSTGLVSGTLEPEPVLTSPVDNANGSTGGSLSVTTNKTGGTLYWYISTSPAQPTASNLKSGSGSVKFGSQAVNASGVQTAFPTALSASTTYYAHFLYADAWGYESPRVSGDGFTTTAGGDVTAPTLSAASATTSGSTGANLSVTTNEGNGTLYWFVSTSSSAPTGTNLKAGTGAVRSGSQGVSATGAQPVTVTLLTASTTYYAYFLHRDAAGNDSTVTPAASSFTTDAGSVVTSFPLTTSPIDSRITFTRSTTAFRINPSTGLVEAIAINTPRIESGGLLVEPSATNNLLHSATFTSGWWTYSGATLPTLTPNATTAPDGTNTAALITGTLGTSFIRRASIGTSNPQQVKSIWAKLGSGTGTVALMGRASVVRNRFSLNTTWQRFKDHLVDTTEANGADFTLIDFRVATDVTQVYLWNAQLEAGSVSTSDIITTTATADRGTDAPNITGTNFSNWFNNTEGTFTVTAKSPGSGTRILLEVSDGSTQNSMFLWTNNTTAMATIIRNGVTVVELTLGTIVANSSFKIALAFKLNDVAAAVTGGSIQTSSSVIIPTVNMLSIGRGYNYYPLISNVSNIEFNNTRVSNGTVLAGVA